MAKKYIFLLIRLENRKILWSGKEKLKQSACGYKKNIYVSVCIAFCSPRHQHLESENNVESNLIRERHKPQDDEFWWRELTRMVMAAIIMSNVEEKSNENEFRSWHKHNFESDLILTKKFMFSPLS